MNEWMVNAKINNGNINLSNNGQILSRRETPYVNNYCWAPLFSGYSLAAEINIFLNVIQILHAFD